MCLVCNLGDSMKHWATCNILRRLIVLVHKSHFNMSEPILTPYLGHQTLFKTTPMLPEGRESGVCKVWPEVCDRIQVKMQFECGCLAFNKLVG
jgi:hypothetical protein